MSDSLLVLTGPTGVGKTDLSIKLAAKLNGEIISADSMQVYRYMDIGSAKISKNEMQGITHYLIDIMDPDTDFNVYLFKKYAQKAIEEIKSKGKLPIVVGGTGFYIQALLYDIDFEDEESKSDYRIYLEEQLKKIGNHAFHELLKDVDPMSYEKIHENNTKRVVRALEYYHDTGLKISDHNEEMKRRQSPYNFKYFVLTDERETLYQQINERVDKMVAEGLVNEVKTLKEMGYGMNNISMQGLGYKEILKYLDGEWSLDKAIEMIKQGTRRFAKRQLTWFNREKEVVFINKNDFDHDTDRILSFILNYVQDW